MHGVLKAALQTGPVESSKEEEVKVGGFVQAYLATWDLNWILGSIHNTFENVTL